MHPGTPQVGTKNGTFTIPTTGHDFTGNTRYRISLTVADSDGLTSTTSVIIQPQKVNVTFNTVPAGLTLYVDGIAKVTPFVYDDLVGFNHTVEARDQSSGGVSYTFASWSDGGAQSHSIVVPTTNQSYVATFQATAGPAPVASYGFNQGSGSTLTDSSGNGINGTINGATWTTAGKYGAALSFNGSSSFVDLGNPAPLRITGSMTWSAWVLATGTPADDGQIIAKSTGNSGSIGWQLKTSPDTGPHTFGIGVSPNGNSITQRFSTTVRNLNTWYHVAGVYDAAARTLHVYVNGVLDDGVLLGTVPASQFDPAQNVIIGRRSGGFHFQGRIDELRVYNTALTQAQIQADMNTPIGNPGPDTQPPTVPTSLVASAVSPSRIDLGWAASADNVGVSGYRVERCQGASCVNFVQVASPPGTTHGDTGLTAATTYRYRVRAADAAGNLSGYSNITSATTLPAADTEPPTVPTSLVASAVSPSRIDLGWAASADNVGVSGYRVERCQGASCVNFVQVASPPGTTHGDTGLAAATTYRYRVRAADAAGNLSGYSNITSATTLPASNSGLVAAYSFNEGIGDDRRRRLCERKHGHDRHGVLDDGRQVRQGIVFNGTNSQVTIADSPSLRLTTGMTLEAWVNPQTVSNAWRDVVYKGNDNYYLSATTTTGSRPAGGAITGGQYLETFGTAPLPLNTWTHLAVTYDGATLRLYVNGVQASSGNRPGSIATSTNPLSMGGDAIYGQYFAGLIDEVRVYNVARTPAQIQADMQAPL